MSPSAANAAAATTSVGSSTANDSGFSFRNSSAILPPTTTIPRAPELLEHAELVLDLRPTCDEGEGTLDLAEQAAQMLELLEQEQPGVCRQQMSDGLGRRVRTMSGPERIVDVEIHSAGELTRIARVVPRLAWIEPRVLEHMDARVGHQLPEPPCDRRDRVPLPVGVGLRTTEMRAHRDLCRIPVEKQLQGGERSADPRVVCDHAVLERHVQIGTHEHTLAVDVGVPNRAGQLHRFLYGSNLCTRSTSRHEYPHSFDLGEPMVPPRAPSFIVSAQSPVCLASRPAKPAFGHNPLPTENCDRLKAATSAQDPPAGTSTPTRCRTSRTPWRGVRSPSSAGCRGCTSTGSP